MSRERIHANSAERQKAYRARMASQQQIPIPKGRQRAPSRPRRLAAILDAVRALQEEYEHWRDRLPDFQEGSEQETRLTETLELLDQALELLTEVQPPKGFGRD